MASFKSAIALALTAASAVDAHSFFHKAVVGGVDQGQLFGVRAPASNSPIQDVTSSAIACNSPLYSPVSTDVISVAPGDSFGMQWNHNIGGPTAGDGDDPIASSHKGPVMVYMAKVSDASTNDGSGLSWFKVAEEGLDTTTSKWGVDTLIAGAGLWSFTMPDLAPGDYLLRGEIIALHSAYSSGGAQFYMSCAAISITGSGTCSPSDTVSFPGAYSASDPSILINIYGSSGQPDNGGKAYVIPGPAVATCNGTSSASTSASASASSTASSTKVAASSSTVAATSATSAVTSAAAPSWTYTYSNATSLASPTKPAGTGTGSSSVAVTATPTTGIAVPSSSAADTETECSPESAAPTSSSAAPSSSSPVEASSTAAASSTAPVSFTSTFTGRIGKPTKFTCYAEE